MKKILVAVDGSAHSRKAFEYALKEAKETEGHLTILQVVPGLGYAGDEVLGALKGEIKNAKELTNKLEEEAEKEGVYVDSKVITGTDISTEIIKFSDEENYDLIVIGSRGNTELETISLGSVSENVVKYAHDPVLIVR